MLKEVEAQTEIKRYRLGSLYPNEIDDEMLEFLSKSEKFCPHFHLSLQSGCDKTLKSMNRHYTVEEYLSLIDKINEKFDLPFIGSDVITGFAGESDEDFEITRKNLDNSALSQIHTFPYSVRKGTKGAEETNQVLPEIKEQRADIIKAISKKKHKEFILKNIGRTFDVLVEKHPDKVEKCLKGVTGNYLTVLLNSEDMLYTNTIITAKLTEYKNGKIYGEIVRN